MDEFDRARQIAKKNAAERHLEEKAARAAKRTPGIFATKGQNEELDDQGRGTRRVKVGNAFAEVPVNRRNEGMEAARDAHKAVVAEGRAGAAADQARIEAGLESRVNAAIAEASGMSEFSDTDHGATVRDWFSALQSGDLGTANEKFKALNTALTNDGITSKEDISRLMSKLNPVMDHFASAAPRQSGSPGGGIGRPLAGVQQPAGGGIARTPEGNPQLVPTASAQTLNQSNPLFSGDNAVDSIFAQRASSGQPTFVGRGSEVFRLGADPAPQPAPVAPPPPVEPFPDRAPSGGAVKLGPTSVVTPTPAVPDPVGGRNPLPGMIGSAVSSAAAPVVNAAQQGAAAISNEAQQFGNVLSSNQGSFAPQLPRPAATGPAQPTSEAELASARRLAARRGMGLPDDPVPAQQASAQASAPPPFVGPPEPRTPTFGQAMQLQSAGAQQLGETINQGAADLVEGTVRGVGNFATAPVQTTVDKTNRIGGNLRDAGEAVAAVARGDISFKDAAFEFGANALMAAGEVGEAAGFAGAGLKAAGAAGRGLAGAGRLAKNFRDTAKVAPARPFFPSARGAQSGSAAGLSKAPPDLPKELQGQYDEALNLARDLRAQGKSTPDIAEELAVKFPDLNQPSGASGAATRPRDFVDPEVKPPPPKPEPKPSSRTAKPPKADAPKPEAKPEAAQLLKPPKSKKEAEEPAFEEVKTPAADAIEMPDKSAKAPAKKAPAKKAPAKKPATVAPEGETEAAKNIREEVVERAKTVKAKRKARTTKKAAPPPKKGFDANGKEVDEVPTTTPFDAAGKEKAPAKKAPAKEPTREEMLNKIASLGAEGAREELKANPTLRKQLTKLAAIRTGGKKVDAQIDELIKFGKRLDENTSPLPDLDLVPKKAPAKKAPAKKAPQRSFMSEVFDQPKAKRKPLTPDDLGSHPIAKGFDSNGKEGWRYEGDTAVHDSPQEALDAWVSKSMKATRDKRAKKAPAKKAPAKDDVPADIRAERRATERKRREESDAKTNAELEKERGAKKAPAKNSRGLVGKVFKKGKDGWQIKGIDGAFKTRKAAVEAWLKKYKPA